MVARLALMSSMAVVTLSLVIGILYHAPAGLDGMPDVEGGFKNLVASAACSVESNAGPIADDPFVKGILDYFKQMEVRPASREHSSFLTDIRRRRLSAAVASYPLAGRDIPPRAQAPLSSLSSP